MSVLGCLEQFSKSNELDLYVTAASCNSAGLVLYGTIKAAIGSESAAVEQQSMMQQKTMHSLVRSLAVGNKHPRHIPTAGSSTRESHPRTAHTSSQQHRTASTTASTAAASSMRCSTPTVAELGIGSWRERGLNHTAADITGTPTRSKSNPRAGAARELDSTNSRLNVLASRDAFLSETAAATAASSVAAFESAAASLTSSAAPLARSFLQQQQSRNGSSSGASSVNASFSSIHAAISPVGKQQRSVGVSGGSSSSGAVDASSVSAATAGAGSRLQQHQQRVQQQQQQMEQHHTRSSSNSHYASSSGSATLRVNRASKWKYRAQPN